MLHLSVQIANPLTIFEKPCKVSCNDLLLVIGVRDQLLQSMELDIMFVISDRDPS